MNLSPSEINQLLSDLKSDDIKKRVHSVKQLNKISEALGPRRTRNDLIPFLHGNRIQSRIHKNRIIGRR